jgi:hypothetical protein
MDSYYELARLELSKQFEQDIEKKADSMASEEAERLYRSITDKIKSIPGMIISQRKDLLTLINGLIEANNSIQKAFDSIRGDK